MVKNQNRNAKRVGGASRRTKSKKRLGRMSQVRLNQQGAGLGGMGNAVMAGSALSRRVQTMAPSIVRGAKSMRIRHRELIAAAVAGSTGFTVQNVFALNPGLAATFPWLAPQAQQWQQYTVHGLRFIWVPIAPTSKAGDVYLVPDYDASDPIPTTETQAADNVDAVVDSCWQDIMCQLDTAALMGLGPRRFVRPCAIAGDIKTFDVGKFFVCTNNESDTTTIGKMFVEYDFEFFEPQNDPNPNTVPQQTSFFSNTAGQSLTTATPANVAFATTVFDPLTFGPAVAGVFTPPAGVYRLEAQVSVNDTSNEKLDVQLTWQKNGSNITGGTAETIGAGSGGATKYSVTAFAVIACNGTDTVNLIVDATGAAGTLTIPANNSALLVSLA